MYRGLTIVCGLMICGLAFTSTIVAQETDFSVVITDSEDPVSPGSTVSFVVAVANAGPDNSPNPVILDISMPMDVPVPWPGYLNADDVARAAIVDAFLGSANFMIDDNIWDDDLSSIYVGDSFTNACESMIIQVRELALPAGYSGNFYYDATLPLSGGISGLAYTTGSGEQVVVNYGAGGCNSNLFDDCAGIPCMGPRLTMHPTIGAPVSLVDDGTDPVGDGCESFAATFPAGHVALIDRGTCNFSLKAENATNAGASGVIIANTDALGVSTPTADSIMMMGCTDPVCHRLIITIPAGFMSYNAGEGLKAAMGAGGVTVFMGVRQEGPEHKQTKAFIWENATTKTDVDPDNNSFTETTRFHPLIFSDGFESGNTSAWLGTP